MEFYMRSVKIFLTGVRGRLKVIEHCVAEPV